MQLDRLRGPRVNRRAGSPGSRRPDMRDRAPSAVNVGLTGTILVLVVQLHATTQRLSALEGRDAVGITGGHRALTAEALLALVPQSPVPTQIVLAHSSSASEVYAAQILSQHLPAVAPRGERVCVVDLAASAGGHVNCYVGPGHVSAAQLVGLRGPTGRGGDDAFLIAQAPKDSSHSIVLAAAQRHHNRTMALKTDDASDEGLPAGASTRALYKRQTTTINDGKSTNTDNAASNFTRGDSTPPTAAIKNNDAIEEGSSRHRSLNSPAPLVCKTLPSRFVAIAWNPTCECTGDEIVRRGGGPCEACYNYSKSKTKPTNYACRVYENIVEFAELHGNIGKPGTCGPVGYEAACNAIDFGTHANISVACAIDPKDPACTRVAPLDLTNPVGTADQPFGEKYLLLNFVQIGQPIMTHPADTLPMVASNGTCSAADRSFSGIWWDNGIAAIAAQAELFFPAYKQAGGQLNELNADWEASMWAPGSCPVSDNATAAGLEAASACLACALLKWRAIEADPRFPAALKKLQAFGFTLNGTLADTMGVYQCVASNDSALRPGGMADCSQLDGLGDGQVNLIAWNALIQKRETDAWVSAMMPAARKSFPSVRLSLFSFYRWSPKFCVVPDVGEAGTPAILNCAKGQGSSGPDVSAPVYYDYWLTFDCLHPHGPRGGVNAPDRCAAAAGFSNTLQKLSKNPNFTFNFTGINIAKATVNHFRQIAQASNGTATELAPWLGFKSFFWDYGCPGYGQPHDFPSSPGCPEPDGYWNERVLHYGMTGAARFYYYNVFYECTYGKRSTHEDDDAMSSSLAELDIVIGCGVKERRWIPDQSVGWGSDFILSGMEVGSERRAWRFTPSLPISPNIPNITNTTRWDPQALVYRNASYLALGPLTVDYDEHLLKTCTITFEHGVVLDVFGGPSEVHLPPGVPTTSAAPFGVWIIQPISAAPPSVRCMLDQQPFEASWPLRSHLLRGRTSAKTDESQAILLKTDVVNDLNDSLRWRPR